MTVEEIQALREEVFADGVITKEEVTMLWEKKDAEEELEWDFCELFEEATMNWLLADGIIDEEEAQFLIDKINEDDTIDDAEDALLTALNDHRIDGGEIPQILIDAFPDYFEDEEEEFEEE